MKLPDVMDTPAAWREFGTGTDYTADPMSYATEALARDAAGRRAQELRSRGFAVAERDIGADVQGIRAAGLPVVHEHTRDPWSQLVAIPGRARRVRRWCTSAYTDTWAPAWALACVSKLVERKGGGYTFIPSGHMTRALLQAVRTRFRVSELEAFVTARTMGGREAVLELLHERGVHPEALPEDPDCVCERCDAFSPHPWRKFFDAMLGGAWCTARLSYGRLHAGETREQAQARRSAEHRAQATG